MSNVSRFRRIATAISFLLAGTLFFAGIVVAPWEAEDTPEAWRDALRGEPDRAQAGAVLLHFGFLAYVPAFFGVLALLRGRWAITGHVAAVAAALGLASMSGFLINDFYDLAIGIEATSETASAIDTRMDGMWGIPLVVAPAFLGVMIGMPLLYVALWRAGWVGAWVPAVVVVSSALSLVAPPGLLWTGVSSALNLVAAAAAAVLVLRLTDEEWAQGRRDGERAVAP